jgi:hypothetical protein
MTSTLTRAPNQDDRASVTLAILHPWHPPGAAEYGEIEYGGLPVWMLRRGSGFTAAG